MMQNIMPHKNPLLTDQGVTDKRKKNFAGRPETLDAVASMI
jgi:hypothetical protein